MSMGTMVGVMAEQVYRAAWRAALPVVSWYVKRKDKRRLLPAAITTERFGYSRIPAHWQQQEGSASFTLWIHGASVGECLSAIPLIDLFTSDRDQFPGTEKRVLLTTTTVAARQLLNARIAHFNSVCILAPLDNPECVSRFLDTWKPDAGLWIESELWPNLILEAARREMRIGIVNGRMSLQSAQIWGWPVLRQFARHFMWQFSLVLCQDTQNSARFQALGVRQTEILPNLKFASSWPSIEDKDRVLLTKSLRERSAWVALSTHDGEELMMAKVHQALKSQLASLERKLLLVIIPRHPARVSEIADAIQAEFPSVTIAFRSKDGVPDSFADIFIVDIMGETALFCDAIRTVVIGGSFVDRGGHNPIEPLRSGCTVFTGPHMRNFTDIVDRFEAAQAEAFPAAARALIPVESASALTPFLQQQLKPNDRQEDRHQLESMMRALAIDTTRAYESRLRQWMR